MACQLDALLPRRLQRLQNPVNNDFFLAVHGPPLAAACTAPVGPHPCPAAKTIIRPVPNSNRNAVDARWSRVAALTLTTPHGLCFTELVKASPNAAAPTAGAGVHRSPRQARRGGL